MDTTNERIEQQQAATHAGRNPVSLPSRLASRRTLLAGLGAFSVLPGSSRTASAHAENQAPIAQPEGAGHESFMRRALEMRQAAVDKGDQAYGAVIVRDGVIVGQSWSRVVIDRDPTAHAEMAAVRDAARRLGDRNLAGTVMYSSSRPCPMCEAAAYWAGISEMIHGSAMSSAGAPKLCR